MADITAHTRLRIRSLEFFLTDRCNLRCRHCSASSPFLRDANLPNLDLFRRSIDALAEVVLTDQLKFLGGEPLLNKHICEFMELAAASGLCRRIRVVTNGVLLPRVPKRFWELADVVEVSLYAGAPDLPGEEELAALTEHAARFGTALEIHWIDRFMQAVSPTRHQDKALVQRIFRSCAEAHEWSCHLLYRDSVYRCSRVHTLDRYLAEAGVPHSDFTGTDGLPVLGKEPGRLRRELDDYLSSERPLSACSFCLGTSGRWEKCRQLTPEEISAGRKGKVEKPHENLLVSEAEAKLRGRILNWEEAEKKGFVRGSKPLG